MNNEDFLFVYNMDNIEQHIMNHDEDFSLIDYVRENYIGLLLLVLAFFIIYLVDYISRINALIFAMPSPIPGVTQTLSSQLPSVKKRIQKRH